MSPVTARKLEYTIIGLGVLALLMIFQPLSIMLFTAGCILVVAAGLINNLLPMARSGVSLGALMTAAMVVTMIFCLVLLLAIAAAHFYGAFFLKQPDPSTMAGRLQLAATPWYLHGFTWTVAALAALLTLTVMRQNRGKRGPAQ